MILCCELVPVSEGARLFVLFVQINFVLSVTIRSGMVELVIDIDMTNIDTEIFKESCHSS